MANGRVDSIEEVNLFLKELKQALCSDNFNLLVHFDIILSSQESGPGSKNSKTLTALNFDRSDVYDTLLSLSAEDYSETFTDTKSDDLPPFYLFGKTIQEREIYIKVRIKNKLENKVFCISFHFAKYPLLKPYATIGGA